MPPTIKFGMLLGLFLFAFGLVIKYLDMGSGTVIQIFLMVIPAMTIYATIRAFLQKDPPRPAYNYGRGVLLGFGVVAIGAILFAIMITAVDLLDPDQRVTFSTFLTHLWHATPNSLIVVLAVPFLFFGKNEKTASLRDEILDTDL